MWNGLKNFQRTAVFISGGGSTLQALLEMQHQIDIKLIVTNKKNADGNLKAKRFGKKVFYLDKKNDFRELNQVLIEHKIEHIVLAGFMKLLPPDFVSQWQDRITNIHPSLLPQYPGLNSAEKSWADNADMGATIHTVIAQIDAGEVKLQQKSLSQPRRLMFAEANLFLRRTEQWLLREFATRYF